MDVVLAQKGKEEKFKEGKGGDASPKSWKQGRRSMRVTLDNISMVKGFENIT